MTKNYDVRLVLDEKRYTYEDANSFIIGVKEDNIEDIMFNGMPNLLINLFNSVGYKLAKDISEKANLSMEKSLSFLGSEFLTFIARSVSEEKPFDMTNEILRAILNEHLKKEDE